jgi:hypothetical protein
VYDELRAEPAVDLAAAAADLRLTPRVRDLVKKLDEVSAAFAPANREVGRSLAEQMFLRNGVFEWVACRDVGKPEWGGLGQPAPGLANGLFELNNRHPSYQREALTVRLPAFGFRLLWRAG